MSFFKSTMTSQATDSQPQASQPARLSLPTMPSFSSRRESAPDVVNRSIPVTRTSEFASTVNGHNDKSDHPAYSAAAQPNLLSPLPSRQEMKNFTNCTAEAMSAPSPQALFVQVPEVKKSKPSFMHRLVSALGPASSAHVTNKEASARLQATVASSSGSPSNSTSGTAALGSTGSLASSTTKASGLIARSGLLSHAPLVPYDSGKDIVAAAALEVAAQASQPKKSEKLTSEQKQTRALAERERRLHEVLGVLEGRKELPEKLRHLEFANFLGDGTYGFVVTASDPHRNNAEVAVKFIFKEKIPANAWIFSETLGQRVPTEIYYLCEFTHPNLVKLIDFCTDDKYVIAVTELHGTSWESSNPVLRAKNLIGFRSIARVPKSGEEGGKGDLNTLSSLNIKQRAMLRPRVSCDLFECIDAHDWFPEDVVRKVFKQIVSVVSYLHQQGIVHRDIKDENIVINEDYDIRLIDFGSAAKIPVSGEPLFDKFLGTMDFAAPEIIEGYRYRGPEVEVFALGVLLYILVFRQAPFKSQQDTINVVYKKPRELAEFYTGAWDLYDLLDKMLKREPGERLCITEVANHNWMTTRTSGR